MKLGEALSLLKKEQRKVARLITLRKEHVYREENQKTTFDPKKLGEEIEDKVATIRKLKIKIQQTNMKTRVKGEDISLAEAILKINDLRSIRSQLSDLFERRSRSLYREREEKELVPQLDEREIEGTIEQLDIEKVKLDNKIQMVNWSTELVK